MTVDDQVQMERGECLDGKYSGDNLDTGFKYGAGVSCNDLINESLEERQTSDIRA